MSCEVGAQGFEPRDPDVSDKMEFVRNLIRNALERAERHLGLFDLPMNPDLEDEWCCRGVHRHRSELFLEPEVHDVHRGSRAEHRLDDFLGPLAVHEDPFAEEAEPTELLDVEVPDPESVVSGQEGWEEVVDGDDQGAPGP